MTLLEKSNKTDAKTSRLEPASNSSNFQFVREDWTLFRSLATLSQRAGVPQHRLVKLVLKELADNALDAAGECSITQDIDGIFHIQNSGPGLPVEIVPELFSIRRPLSSSKLFRLPTRGAMGNGLRVVTGAVLAKGGSLTVWTRGKQIKLYPQDDGCTQAISSDAPDFTDGTRIDIRFKFSDESETDESEMNWAKLAIDLARHGQQYTGRTSPHWYGPVAFWELCQAAGNHTVRELIEQFDGCTGATAGKIAGQFKGRIAGSLSRDDAKALLATAQEQSRPVKPKRLGYVGPEFSGEAGGYGKSEGSFFHDHAEIPFVVEAWAWPNVFDRLQVCVNRTPIAGEVEARHDAKNRSDLCLFGCGLSHGAKVGRDSIAIILNITTPYMPITTDGKEPDLSHFVAKIMIAIAKAARCVKRLRPKSDEKPQSQKEIVKLNLEAGCAKASGGGKYRFALRQLFYAIRPHIIEATGKEPTHDYFSQLLTEIEAEQGDIKGMYRDPRGILYHPHTHEEIPLGTVAVENYQRPDWTFNKILYSEKEGFISILKESGWPERNDCALVTSKGYASRAVRDVLDLLGRDGEPLEFFCIHDADAAGTMIYQALQGETKARPGRSVKIINLGLEPDEALQMGLESERVQSKGRRPAADYVHDQWKKWLQDNRVELNAMTTPQFMAWLDRKMQNYAGKVVPPDAVLVERLESNVRDATREKLVAKAIEDARIDERTDQAITEIMPRLNEIQRGLTERVKADLHQRPDRQWTSPISEIASEIVENEIGGGR